MAILYLSTQGIALWVDSLRVFFSSLLTGQPPIQQAAISVLQLVLDPRILRLIPIFLLPFLFSREAASRYLADIFELDNEIEDVKIARKFVSEVSLGGADNHLTISVDNFDSDDTKSSPLRMIGGPGRVTVALGTAILVETPDGIPRIIGPAYSEPVQVNQDLALPST